MSKSIAAGTTLIGSTSYAPALGRITLARRYAYVRIWRFWMRLGRSKSA